MINRREAVAGAADRLRAAGIDSGSVDSELLLAHCLGLARTQLMHVEELEPSAIAAFDAAVARRAQREPLQYIVGDVAFRHVVVPVGPGVFIPRPETELLVDVVAPALRAVRRPVVVDLCAGSGALALAIANEYPAATIWAVELSPPALVWLRGNAAGTGLHVVAGDVRDSRLLSGLAAGVDVVVSNPPYVPTSRQVAPEVSADPPEAVFAGVDGLALLPSVIARAGELLRPGGTFAVEHDDTHAVQVPELLRADGRWTDVERRRDLSGRSRFALAVRA
ncbi:MAG: peptide chain release factor N(5)-glutamine methyltransferase [Actinomycetota bacterium]|nr:peptide chain release factor N(5)-glutamine methyltransferase [Actinomycetota bacterium]